MTNTFEKNARLLNQMIPEFSDLLDVFTGKIETDGSLNPNPQSGLTGNYIWTHDARGNRRVQNALEIAAKVAGRSVTIGLSRRTQEYEVLRLNAAIPDEVQGVVSIGDVILAKAENFSHGFVIPQTGLGVYISPFHYHGGTWKGGTLTVTPTATAGMKAALLIGVNTLTGLAVQALGTDAADNELFILSPFDDDIVRVKAENPDVAWRSVVVVSNGATDFAGATFYSIGEWGITEPKHNYSASGAPAVTDDADAGYSVGSVWYDGADIYDNVDASAGAAAWSLRASAGVGLSDFPKRATIWHDDALVTAGNALLSVHDTQQNYAVYSVQNTPADGDTFTHGFFLRGGSYTLAILGLTYANSGLLDIYLDNVIAVTGQDWYTLATTFNVVKTAAVTVVGDGAHVLKGVINGKHASSGDYNAALTKLWFYPAAD